VGIELQTIEYSDNGGGSDFISSPTKGEENISTENLNVEYDTDGAIKTRNGSSILNKGSQLTTNKKSLATWDYRKSDGTVVQILCSGTDIYHDVTSPVSYGFTLSALEPIPDLEFHVTNDDEYLLWGNGIDVSKKFNGTDWTNLSIARPTAVTFNALSSGCLPVDSYDYYVSFARTVSSVIVQESELSPVFQYVVTGDSDSGQATSGTVNDLTDTTKLLYSSQATAGGTNFLTDTTVYLGVNTFKDLYLNITGGTGAGQTAKIISNTNDTFTIEGSWVTPPNATSTYDVSEWSTDFWATKTVYISSGTGVGQTATIASNTSTVLTFTAPLAIAPDNTSEYSIGSVSITLNVPISSDAQVNARVIYRKSLATGVIRRLTAEATIGDNTTLTYVDNIADEDLSTIEAEFDNQEAPLSAVFEEFEGKIFYRDETSPTDFLISKAYKGWNVPYNSRTILDAKITAMKRCFNVIVIGTERSIWTQDVEGNLRRVSSTIGILNNRCLDGETSLYFIGSNKAFYNIEPTQLVQDNMTFGEPLSRLVGPAFKDISGSGLDEVQLKLYIKSDVNKIVISVPVGVSTNNYLYIFNTKQSLVQGHPVWQFADNIKASTLQIFNINEEIELISGDYNGFFWKLDDDAMNGDGAEVNGTSTGSNIATTLNDTTQVQDTGTATSGAFTTLTDTSKVKDSGTASSGSDVTLVDTTKTWVIGAYIGLHLIITGGTGSGQTATILSNTEDTLTFLALSTPLDGTSVYVISEWTTNEWALEQVYIVSGTGAGQYVTVASNTYDTLTFTAPMGTAPAAGSVYSLGGWVINTFTGINITIVSGTGEGQTRTILSNTDSQVTVSAWTETPDDTSEYTIGGYVAKHFSNWKKVTSSYELLKQLWFMWVNANASGDYTIQMILQFDFDTSLNNQITTLISLKSQNTIWGAFIWALAIWGSRSVFLDRFRQYAKFRSVRVGFYHNLAGQPYQINNYALSVQDKGLYYKTNL
jgi:hypothetical protein